LLRLGVYQLLRMRVETHAAVDESVRLAKTRGLHRVAGLVNAALRAVASHPTEYWDRLIGQSTTSLHSHPSWIAAEIERALAECEGSGELSEALDAHNQAPLVTLCHLPGLSVRPTEAPTPYSPCGSILSGGDPASSPGVTDNKVRVQDEGSQLAALLLTRSRPLREGEKVWDMCAGPGGKTALLVSEAGPVGATTLATEISAHRAALVEDSTSAVRTAYPGSLEVKVADSRVPRATRFDRILLDAPCSGLGALRRRPEARWVKTKDSIAGLITLQESLLRTGLDCLAPGGVLAYVTCSPVVEETTSVVSRVVGEDSQCGLLDTPSLLEGMVDSPITGHRRGSAVQLWTHRHGTDAMFIQLIERLV
jgi:16S rRNA (cytosine967-C5)-methyltransferase